jgi:ATP/ADP translocase
MLKAFLLKISRTLWGDLTRDEAKKFGILSITLMFILGNYWMLRTTKNAIFGMFVDFQANQPYAKLLSLVVMALLVLVYSKLIDMFKKDTVFYILSCFFGLWLLGLSYCIANPNMVSVGEGSFLAPYVSWIPGKALGWLVYITFEAITLMIALFWAFVASTTKTESAKRGYGLMIFVAQIGTIAGSAFVANYAKSFGLANIVMLGGFFVLAVSLLIKWYMAVIPHEDVVDSAAEAKKPKTGFFEGLKLLATRPYVMGVFVVATTYEIVGTILEFQMNSLGSIVYPDKALFAQFNAQYGIGVNSLAFVFSLIGTSFFMRKLGLRFCLMAFPTIIGCIVTTILVYNYMNGGQPAPLMWALFFGMVGIKGLSYALNNPTKEVMYIPTSKDIKFKAKGWIDLFGGRTTKGAGSGITIAFKDSLPNLLLYGSLISLGIIGIWVIIAMYVGNKFNKLQKDNTIIQ